MFARGVHQDLRVSLDAIAAAVALFECDGESHASLVSANERFCEVFGCELERSIGRPLRQALAHPVAAGFDEPVSRCLASGAAVDAEIEVAEGAGSRWWRLVVSPVRTAAGRRSRAFLTAVDITPRHQLAVALETSRRRFVAVVDSAHDAIVTANVDGRIEMMNRAARRMFGLDDSVIGQPLDVLIPEGDRVRHRRHFIAFRDGPVASRTMQERATVRARRSDGSEFPAEVTIAKIDLGTSMELTAVLRDVSERVRLIEELRVAAATDTLTGIANRRRIDEAVRAELLRCERFGHAMSVLLVDIDRFKCINDAWGHAAGDETLRGLSARMGGILREVDMIGRWGGDELLVVLPETRLDGALTVAEALRRAAGGWALEREPGRWIRATVSIGVAAWRPGDDAAQLVQRADAAMYRAKREGRDRVSS